MVAQHTQDEDTTTENSRSDDNSSNTSDADTEQTDAQSEHDIDEMKDAAATELYDIESAIDGPHNGVERGRIIGFLRDEFNVSEDRAEEVIHTALMEGYCYEPGVSEETGDELLKPITKPITDNESDQPADSDEESETTNHEPTSEGGEDAPEDSASIDLDQIQSFFQGNTSDTHTVKSITESVESGLLTGSEIALDELESAIRDSQWDGELREVVLSAIETLREEREAQREFNRKIENGEIETNTEFPTPPEQEMQEGDGPPRPPVDPDAEPEPEWDDTDPILDEYHDHYQPEFPGQMSGESIHLEDDDMEWREPRSLY
ncbi:hypothetical protein MUK72_15235 (plasmid) [Halococcus dombrowskii]|uniref:Uncharacterized protein n=1 Tax=Halococcus dombrowskii TaxID=179637 RepID=A0AAV3SBS4_HALDO|nr:hypothetical protein [Halococcus dombrowskii]UOO96873.1 hypothetical protein MUK72_15235 [Halococcus dombrowskii]